MELCKKVQAEAYVIHVVESTNFYTRLRFSLLASPWFPRPLGLAMWSVLHMLLVLYTNLMLLALFSISFAFAFSFDALILCVILYLLLLVPVTYLFYFLIKGIVIAVVWMFLVISCKCCTMAGRSPDQGLVHYILSAGGLLTPLLQNSEYSIMGNSWDRLKEFPRSALTVRLVKLLTVESFRFWRMVLGNLSREIVPLYDTVVI